MNEYATRTIKIWIDNTKDKYYYFQELAAEAREQATDPEEVIKILAEEVETVISEENPLKDTQSLYDDILTEVRHADDYFEIAESILDE